MRRRISGLLSGTTLEHTYFGPWNHLFHHVQYRCAEAGVEPYGTLTGSSAVDMFHPEVWVLRWELELES